MAAMVRLATRRDVPLLDLMVHELAEVEGMASGCKSTPARLSDLLFTHAPFEGPTVFLLEVDEPAKEERSKGEEAMASSVVTKPIPEASPLLEEEFPGEGVLGATASVELMLFRSERDVNYKGRFSSKNSLPKSSGGNPLQTTDVEEPVLEVFRSSSDVNLKEYDGTVAVPEDLRAEVVSELRSSVEDPEVETFRSQCKASRIVVGYLHVFPNFSTYLTKPGLYMEALYIRKPYRHLGLGKVFFKKVAKEAVKLGMERMEWSVLFSNDPAIRFYDSLGAMIKPGFRRCVISDQALANCEA